MPLKYRYFYRFCIFSYKIINKQILETIHNSLKTNNNLNYGLRESSQSIFLIPFCKSNKNSKRLSIILPKLVNYVLKNSINHLFRDFKSSLFSNLETYYKIFVAKNLY